jgi:sugar phosphate isomerase/epimerase
MILGLRAHDFGRHTPEVLAQKISDAGFETAQLALLMAITGVETIADVSDDVLERVGLAFEKYKLQIGVHSCYMEIGYADKQARLAEVDKFLLGLEHGKALGAGLVGTETTHFVPKNEADREPLYQGLKDSVLRMAERAEKLGIDIGVEPVAVHTMNSAETTKRLLEEVGSSRLKVIFDPVNLMTTQVDVDNQSEIISDFFNLLGDDIVALHVKDVVIADSEKIWRNIGKGDIDFAPIFQWFNNKGRNIPALREEVSPDSYSIDLNEMRRLNNIR